jgi:hypothetical protein
MASPYLTPPELEYLRLEPRVLTVGDPLRISLKVRRDLGRSPTASASIWGQGGWNTGFTIDKREPDGSLSRTLDRWPQAGFFTLSQLTIVDGDTGKAFSLPVHVTFEALVRETPPLTPESPLFTTP